MTLIVYFFENNIRSTSLCILLKSYPAFLNLFLLISPTPHSPFITSSATSEIDFVGLFIFNFSVFCLSSTIVSMASFFFSFSFPVFSFRLSLQ